MLNSVQLILCSGSHLYDDVDQLNKWQVMVSPQLTSLIKRWDKMRHTDIKWLGIDLGPKPGHRQVPGTRPSQARALVHSELDRARASYSAW